MLKVRQNSLHQNRLFNNSEWGGTRNIFEYALRCGVQREPCGLAPCFGFIISLQESGLHGYWIVVSIDVIAEEGEGMGSIFVGRDQSMAKFSTANFRQVSSSLTSSMGRSEVKRLPLEYADIGRKFVSQASSSNMGTGLFKGCKTLFCQHTYKPLFANALTAFLLKFLSHFGVLIKLKTQLRLA